MIPFGLIFAGMGGVFVFFILSDLIKEAATYRWIETPCEIQKIEIIANQSKGNSPFRMDVQFGYLFEGRNFTSNQYARSENWSGNYEQLAIRRTELRAASESAVCYVNPENPSEAVMKREAFLKSLIILFPLVFVAVGLGLAIAGFRSLRKSRTTKKGVKLNSISRTATTKGRSERLILLIFGVAFTLIGGILSIFLGVIPISRMMDSNGWQETPCKVIWSRVLSHRGDDSTTYSVDIFYKYEVAGVEHRSNRYGFIKGSSSGRQAKQAVVREYRKGSDQVCFVNPELPEQATLVRGLTPRALLGLLPLLFFFIGIAILIGWKRNGKKKASRGISEPESVGGMKEQHFAERGPRVLKPGASRIGGVFVMLFIALFWNGIISVFLVQVYDGFKRGNPEWFLTIFMIPFVLVGLGILFAFLYKLLSLANAKPVVTMDQGQPRLGEESSLSWQIFGNSRRISQFTIEVWGIESATYRRGTNTVTDKEVFFQRTLADSADGGDLASGRVQFRLPEDLAPSMDLGSNEIIWQIRVKGDVPFFPDVNDSYDIEVLPAGFS